MLVQTIPEKWQMASTPGRKERRRSTRMQPTLGLWLFLSGHLVANHSQAQHDFRAKRTTDYHFQGSGLQGKTQIIHKIIATNTEFAFSLYRLLATDTPDKNIFFSPLSISTAFAMLSLGARSTTQMQILEGLGFNLNKITENEIHEGFKSLIHTVNLPSDELQMNMGNTLFIRKQLNLWQKFLGEAHRLYSSKAFPTNFQDTTQAEKHINDYVANKTRGRIMDIVKGLNSRTAMVLVSYVFFKAKWVMPFDPKDTREQKFYPANNVVLKVPMMIQQGYHRFLQDTKLACSVLEMKYKHRTSALFILPHEGKIQQVENALSGATLIQWNRLLKIRPMELHFPRFSMTENYELKRILIKLGIDDVFTVQADLSKITGRPNLKLSKVFHKALLNVSEEGTEAAADTVIKIPLVLPEFFPIEVVCFNRPFLVIILDTLTGSILFLGKVVDPYDTTILQLDL
ncbi:alpha-1-antichymotrypsin-like isoform X2 [Tachyglossus aculeatus]|uniref:alpha-1-antichymotrypsin-like isoform X2 n=1 Tax=Tachyglossus aculeatus TaxID=9261 RepID=UPI0018F471B8|nr:alpha-1-antichymotrypsin-like isoform X2 [Tachyglossus aculeatus]